MFAHDAALTPRIAIFSVLLLSAKVEQKKFQTEAQKNITIAESESARKNESSVLFAT